jgi:hypothetical protein
LRGWAKDFLVASMAGTVSGAIPVEQFLPLVVVVGDV